MSPSGQTPKIGLRQRIVELGREHKLQRSFWILYLSSFLVDLGLCLYFFMFSLFLVEHGFSERSIGYLAAMLTIGNLTATVPVSILSRRIGLRAMLLIFVIAAPVCLGLRAVFLPMSAQLVLAFVSGACISIWFVCFSPALAKLTTQENRAFGFGLFVATGIGSGALAGMIGGYLPGLLGRMEGSGSGHDNIMAVLLLSCLIVSLAAVMILRLSFDNVTAEENSGKVVNGFLVRFLLAIAVWNFSMGFFMPFANVYLARHLGLAVASIGTIYTVSQSIQVAAVLFAPVLYRRIGLIPGIALTQAGTALMLWGLSRATGPATAVPFYLLLTALQWMSGPGIYSLLMNRTQERHRGQASAMQNFVNLTAQAGSAALAGKAFQQSGYSGPLAANAGLAALAALLLYTLLRQSDRMPIQVSLAAAESTNGLH